ncbi:hypothetical protein BS47DRAFT_1358081 [Hydnum rufescens UP504]|uniref:HNH nuclease domain-containing protein n=1 Tax=Hydnum rufescens UP504 TaxID=1448309 RepID=A0A9P6B9N2_9AGAM|nr:hypothetical protein BS47DRAFT_1358081 [Hydnum rufescens UP504]
MSDGSPVPPGYVRLILALDPCFYLEIPLTEIDALCLSPRKYLVFLAWCILDLSHAVDPKVVKTGTTGLSQTTETRDAFRDELLGRDGQCVFTGADAVVMHIIPFKCGSEWFRRIVENRAHDDENVENLTDINDIRNGMLALDLLRTWFDARGVAILKTPNRYLNRSDIPPRANRLCPLPVGATYPLAEHYTIQWLGQPALATRLMLPNNSEAAFISGTGGQSH